MPKIFALPLARHPRTYYENFPEKANEKFTLFLFTPTYKQQQRSLIWRWNNDHKANLSTGFLKSVSLSILFSHKTVFTTVDDR